MHMGRSLRSDDWKRDTNQARTIYSRFTESADRLRDVSARPSLCGAARAERDAGDQLEFVVREACENRDLCIVTSGKSRDRANAITLSCKSRLPHRGSPGGAAA